MQRLSIGHLFASDRQNT